MSTDHIKHYASIDIMSIDFSHPIFRSHINLILKPIINRYTSLHIPKNKKVPTAYNEVVVFIFYFYQATKKQPYIF